MHSSLITRTFVMGETVVLAKKSVVRIRSIRGISRHESCGRPSHTIHAQISMTRARSPDTCPYNARTHPPAHTQEELDAEDARIAGLTATELAAAMRDGGTLTCERAVGAFCRRAGAIGNARTNAVAEEFYDEAVEAARVVDEGRGGGDAGAAGAAGAGAGILQGIPISIKDTMHMKGAVSARRVAHARLWNRPCRAAVSGCCFWCWRLLCARAHMVANDTLAAAVSPHKQQRVAASPYTRSRVDPGPRHGLTPGMAGRCDVLVPQRWSPVAESAASVSQRGLRNFSMVHVRCLPARLRDLNRYCLPGNFQRAATLNVPSCVCVCVSVSVASPQQCRIQGCFLRRRPVWRRVCLTLGSLSVFAPLTRERCATSADRTSFPPSLHHSLG